MSARIGRYRVIERLDRGGMGEIYLAKYPAGQGLWKFVAIKKIRAQGDMDPRHLKLFKYEAMLALRLEHRAIVAMEEFGIHEGQFFMVMDYVEGKNLFAVNDRLESKGMRFFVAHALFIVSEVALALEYARRTLDRATGKPLGIVHGDISPNNIMVTYDGDVKIIDFGVARTEADINVTMVEMKMGKKGYMSPEQALGLDMDPRSDQFSLGVVLWELIAGEKMFSELSRIQYLNKIEKFRYPSLQKLNAEVTPELDQVIRKMLSFDPSDRYGTAGELYRDLSHVLHSIYPEFSQEDLREAMRSLYAVEMAEERLKLQESSAETVNEEEIFESAGKEQFIQSAQEREATGVREAPVLQSGLWKELHVETRRLRRKVQTYVTLAFDRLRSDLTGTAAGHPAETGTFVPHNKKVLDKIKGGKSRSRRRRNRKIKRWFAFYYPVIVVLVVAASVLYVGFKPSPKLVVDNGYEEEAYEEAEEVELASQGDNHTFEPEPSEPPGPEPLAEPEAPAPPVSKPAVGHRSVEAASKPISYDLRLLSRPSGAKIYLDGRYVGKTPTVLGFAQNKGRRFTFKKSGYQTVKKKIWPKKGKFEVRLNRVKKRKPASKGRKKSK